MTRGTRKNIQASIHQRLLNKAKEKNRPFNELLQHYALERFLYRLSVSSYRKNLILKGASLFAAWKATKTRPTKDIDFLGRSDNSVENIEKIIKEICLQEVVPDGLAFDPESVTGHTIVEDADYSGVRVAFRGNLGNALIHMQVDVGFGDLITPGPEIVEYPTILNDPDYPTPKIFGYSRESVIAEKFEAMTKLGELNSRIRDFYDIWYLSNEFEFIGNRLAAAISTTFRVRETEIDPDPVALTGTFSENPTKETQYQAFIRKSLIEDAPDSLNDLIVGIADFLIPVAEAQSAGKSFRGIWRSPGPWQIE